MFISNLWYNNVMVQIKMAIMQTITLRDKLSYYTVKIIIQMPETCFMGFNDQYGSIGSDDDFAPNRQAIIWTNGDLD